MARWGSLDDLTEDSSGSLTSCWIAVGNFNPGSNQALDDLVWYGTMSSTSIRFAVYQGGVSDTDPTGATLIWQSATLSPTLTNQWYTATADGSTLVNNTRTFLCAKAQGGTNTRYTRNSSGSDLAAQRLFNGDTTAGFSMASYDDPFPSTFPSGTSVDGTFPSKIAINYSAAAVPATPPYINVAVTG